MQALECDEDIPCAILGIINKDGTSPINAEKDNSLLQYEVNLVLNEYNHIFYKNYVLHNRDVLLILRFDSQV